MKTIFVEQERRFTVFCDGRDTFFGVDCIFVENHMGMNIYPIDERNIIQLFKHIGSVDFPLEYKSQIYDCTTINVHRMKSSLNRGFELYANYVVKRINDTPISVMEITSEAIDSLFSTVKYYYRQKRNGKRFSVDLLYDRDVVDTWTINHEGKEIKVSLFYGEVLRGGISSDATIHPKLSISFPGTYDAQELYEIYSLVKFFLQTTRYGFNIGKTCVDLISMEGEKETSLGYLYDFSTQNSNCTISEIKYVQIKEYIGPLLQFAADHHDMQIDFFPKDYHGLLNDSYNGLLFASLFAGFERECHSAYELYEKADDSSFRDKKDEIIKLIREKKAEDATKYKEFYNGIEERVEQYGTQVGQVRKILNAYEVLAEALKKSMQNIFFMPSFRINGIPTQDDIKKIAKTIMSFRGKVIHEGDKSTFSDDETPYVQFLEILVYSMMLKRVGITDNGIELIIGMIFHCNFVAMEMEVGHKSKE